MLEKLLRSKVVVWIAIILPGLWPAWPIFVRPDSSVLADPLKYILLHLGFVACVLLAVVLSFSPLRVIFPGAKIPLALNRHRRLVGVAAFAYGLLHFTTHLLYEGVTQKGLGPILRSDFTKPFLLTGMVTLLILTALAVTSPHFVLKRMGARNWKWLHRLAYLAAGLAAYHQAAARKVFPVQVLWIFVPLVILEAARIYRNFSARRRSENTA